MVSLKGSLETTVAIVAPNFTFYLYITISNFISREIYFHCKAIGIDVLKIWVWWKQKNMHMHAAERTGLGEK